MDNLVEMLKYHVNGGGEGHVAELRKKQRAQKLHFLIMGIFAQDADCVMRSFHRLVKVKALKF